MSRRVKKRTPVRRAWRWLKAEMHDLSLPSASALTILGLVAAAGLVLWLTGRPEGGEWWDFHPKVLDWKDRLAIAGAVAAGAGAAIALVVSYRKQSDAEDGKFAAAFASAATQLGDQAPAVRIAGAYALAALADGYAQHRQQCIDALCAYLRLSYTPEADKQNLTSTTHNRELTAGATSSDTITYRAGDREVRLTIIRIIRDHLQDPHSPTTWCGRDLDFTGATFDGGDFEMAIFSEGSVVSFDNATFLGDGVAFRGANFSEGSVVSFEDASFSGDRVLFNGTTFAGGLVLFDDATFSANWVSFNAAKFAYGLVWFNRAMFTGGLVSFDGATFSGSEVSFKRATFSDGRVTFNQATHTGVGKVSFEGVTFTGGEVSKDGQPFRGFPSPRD